jgi:8-oxo-dGTP diphosphatase
MWYSNTGVFFMYNDELYSKKRPNVGVTIIPFIYDEGEIKALTYKRDLDAEVFPGRLAFPNCFYDRENVESAEEAAIGALLSKTSIELPYFEQLHTFSGNYIDPERINTVNITYFSLVRLADVSEIGDPHYEKEWLTVDEIIAKKDLFAFNHYEVFDYAWKRIRAKAEYTPIATNLLDEMFTIVEFKKLTEKLLGFELNNARLRDRIEVSELLIPCEGMFKTHSTKPAQLYRLNPLNDGVFYPRSMTKAK